MTTPVVLVYDWSRGSWSYGSWKEVGLPPINPVVQETVSVSSGSPATISVSNAPTRGYIYQVLAFSTQSFSVEIRASLDNTNFYSISTTAASFIDSTWAAAPTSVPMTPYYQFVITTGSAAPIVVEFLFGLDSLRTRVNTL